MRSWGWGKHTEVWSSTKKKKESPHKQPLHVQRAIKRDPALQDPHITVKPVCPSPCGLQTWFKPWGNNAVLVSCLGFLLKGNAAFPAHGHRVQPCETEQVTHTALSHPLFLAVSERGKGRTKAPCSRIPCWMEPDWNITSSSALSWLLP